MLQNNPLLAQLKQQLREALPIKEGIVRATAKSFGFLEVSDKESLFISPPYMKKVLHGDRISAVVHTEGDKTQAEPQQLLEAGLNQFVGQVTRHKNKLRVQPANALIRDSFNVKASSAIALDSLQEGDWVRATLCQHALKDEQFAVTIDELIAKANDPQAPWYIVLARHQLPKTAPEASTEFTLQDPMPRQDFTEIAFFTIDNASTQDMDDAISIRATPSGWELLVAVADPDAYIQANSELDQQALQRGFTTYLPGWNIPMLPRALADELCSLQQGERRPALCARMQIAQNGELEAAPEFALAWVCSYARLDYQQVSDFIEHRANWQPECPALAEQLQQLHRFTLARQQWRQQHAVVFQDRPDYRFELDANANVVAIHAEHRRIANQMVEEAMIVANQACGDLLASRLGYGLFNVHSGFDMTKQAALNELLAAHQAPLNSEQVSDLAGYSKLRRWLTEQTSPYLDSRLRRFQAYAAMSIEPAPHFAMGLSQYATWTSPIRKYGDLVNQRLIKAIIAEQTPPSVAPTLPQQLAEQRKVQRKAERDIADWLYQRYLQPLVGTDTSYTAEIFDINRAGIRVRLLEIGATAFMPSGLLSNAEQTLKLNWEEGRGYVAEQVLFELGQQLSVTLHDASEPGNIIVLPLG